MFRSRFLLLYALLMLAVAVNVAPSQQPTKDLHGDPLPDGAIARIGTVRWRHSDVVAFAAFLPDSKKVICASMDGVIRLWDFPSGKELRRIPAPSAFKALNAVALSADGQS